MRGLISSLLLVVVILSGCSAKSENVANLEEDMFEKADQLVRLSYNELNGAENQEGLTSLKNWCYEKLSIGDYDSTDEELFFSQMNLINQQTKLLEMDIVGEEWGVEGSDPEVERIELEELYMEMEELFGINYDSE